MRLSLALLLMISAVACSRKVVVTTPGNPAANAPTLKVTNNAAQSVTVYYTVAGGSEVLIGQVPANSTQVLSVNGVVKGTMVRLRAGLADGSRSYTRDSVTLEGVFEWQVP